VDSRAESRRRRKPRESERYSLPPRRCRSRGDLVRQTNSSPRCSSRLLGSPPSSLCPFGSRAAGQSQRAALRREKKREAREKAREEKRQQPNGGSNKSHSSSSSVKARTAMASDKMEAAATAEGACAFLFLSLYGHGSSWGRAPSRERERGRLLLSACGLRLFSPKTQPPPPPRCLFVFLSRLGVLACRLSRRAASSPALALALFYSGKQSTRSCTRGSCT
jgi:hypothetical protein